ncbi:MAG: rhodanese-like domain-containing protein [Ichthyobacteriaceae bacterium]|nr:rhodanese-like domain-containing protein [Ichthyobacteriaceae bacterium]
MKTKPEIINPFIALANHLTPAETLDYVDQNEDVVIIDLRPYDKFMAGHLKGAINVDRGALETDVTTLWPNPDTKFVLYCVKSGISSMAQLTLKEYGYKNVIDIQGGVVNFVSQGYPLFNAMGEVKFLALDGFPSI